MNSYFTCSALLALVAILVSCQQKFQKEYPYLIKINIIGRTNCSVSLLSDLASHKKMDNVTSTMRGSHYVLKGTITQPGIYKVSCKCPDDLSMHPLAVYLPADSIQATVVATPPANLRFAQLYKQNIGSYLRDTKLFSTSPKQQELESYLLAADSLWNKYFIDQALIRAKFMQTLDGHNKLLIDQWADSANHFSARFPYYMSAAVDVFVQKHPRSEIALYAMFKDNNASSTARARYQHYYQAMPLNLQQSFYGQLLNQRLTQPK